MMQMEKENVTKSDSHLEAMHKWWDAAKRKNPDKTPSPAASFEAGFYAAQAIYMAHTEEALSELIKLREIVSPTTP